MKDITILVDTTCDLDIDFMKENNINFLPITVDLNGEVFKDRVELTTSEFYERIKNKDIKPKTSLISPSDFEDEFKNELAKGNQVLCITVSSTLSGTFNSARLAKDIIDSEDIQVIDSQNVSGGLQILIQTALSLIKDNKTLIETKDYLESLKDRIKCLVYIDDMEMLKRGGRISGAVASIGGVLNIKPILHLKEGTLEPVAKIRGKKAAIKYIVDTINNTSLDKQFPVAIASSNDELIIDELKNKLDAANSKTLTLEIGASVGSHAGEKSCAIWYVV